MSRRGWLLFAAMCVLWGVPYLLIKVAVREFSPAELVFARTALAGVLLVPIALWRKEIRSVLPYWRPLLAYTMIEVAVPWLLLSDAERHVTSSLSGLVIAGVPLVVAVLARLLDARERLTRNRVLGLSTGFVGVALLVGFDPSGAGTWPLVELAGVVLCYAVGPIVADRWLAGAPPLGVSAVALAAGAVLFAPFVVPGLPALADRVTLGPGLAVLALAVLCTAVAFVVFFALIAEAGAARSMVFTFVNPAVAVVLGATLLNEPVTAVTMGAFALILTGSLLATTHTPRAVPGADVGLVVPDSR